MGDSKRRILSGSERRRVLLDFGFDGRLLAVLDDPCSDAVASAVWHGPGELGLAELLEAASPIYWDILPEGAIAPVVRLSDCEVYFLLLVTTSSGATQLVSWHEEFTEPLVGGVTRFLVESLDSLWEREFDRDTICRFAQRIGCCFAAAFLDERLALGALAPTIERHELLLADFTARHA